MDTRRRLEQLRCPSENENNAQPGTVGDVELVSMRPVLPEVVIDEIPIDKNGLAVIPSDSEVRPVDSDCGPVWEVLNSVAGPSRFAGSMA